MELGAFSVGLAVKDIDASKAFYEKLGFTVYMGDRSQNWLILKNGDCTIGLFQGMFEKNSDAQPLGEFTDIRELQLRLEEAGVEILTRAAEGSTGPASFVIADPDGNPILVDQHV